MQRRTLNKGVLLNLTVELLEGRLLLFAVKHANPEDKRL